MSFHLARVTWQVFAALTVIVALTWIVSWARPVDAQFSGGDYACDVASDAGGITITIFRTIEEDIFYHTFSISFCKILASVAALAVASRCWLTYLQRRAAAPGFPVRLDRA